MKNLNKIFFKGLFTLLPVTITIYVLLWVVRLVDSILGSLIQATLPAGYYIPGLGFIATIVVIFLFGLLLENYLTQKLFSETQKFFTQIPFIKAIYSPLKDLMNLFSKENKQGMKNVVLVDLYEGVSILGIVTRDQFEDLKPEEAHFQQMVSVYIPLSYALGGYTVLVPKTKTKMMNIPVEKAMSLAITGWVKTEETHSPPSSH